MVHIMKALAGQPSAAASLIEDESLQLLFQMIASGSLTVFARFREGLVPLHTIQLHRHAMQVQCCKNFDIKFGVIICWATSYICYSSDSWASSSQ